MEPYGSLNRALKEPCGSLNRALKEFYGSLNRALKEPFGDVAKVLSPFFSEPHATDFEDVPLGSISTDTWPTSLRTYIRKSYESLKR